MTVSPAEGLDTLWTRNMILRKHLGNFALACAFVTAGTLTVSAGTFDVKSPEVTKGETEISVNSAFFNGYPINSELIRNSWEASIGYGVTSWWTAGLKINLDQPIGAPFQASTVGTEHLFLARKFENGFGLGWYTGVDVAVHSDTTNTATFGPIFKFGTDKTALAVNTFLAQTFGKNRDEGIAFAYAWQAKHELREGYAIGIEGYGNIKDIGNNAGLDFQEHRVGPVGYYERALTNQDGGPKFKFEAGVLFGLTAGTQDMVVKAKGGVTF